LLCEDCGKEEATVKLTQIIKNQKTEINLCLDCAKKKGWKNPLEGFPLAEFLASMVQLGEAKKIEGETAKEAQIKCPVCGITFVDFAKQGRLGCGNCYKVFREQIQDLLRKIHGSDVHRGKIPSTVGEMAVILQEERKLQEKLKKAISEEDFELAAQIRDKLKALLSDKQ